MIKCENLFKSFNEINALKQIDLELNEGKIYGLIGKNGAGKSTLLKTIIGLEAPTSGKITMNGNTKIDIDRFGYLPEQRGLSLNKSIIDEMIFLGRLKGVSKKLIVERVEYWLEYLQVVGTLKTKIGALSKGNQQKVQLIATLLSEPDILILDEPFSGIDPVTAEQFIRIILDYKAKGCLVIFSTHRMEDIDSLCDEVIMLKQGELKFVGNKQTVEAEYGVTIFETDKAMDNEKFTNLTLIEQKNMLNFYQINCTNNLCIKTLKTKIDIQDHNHLVFRTYSFGELFKLIEGVE